MYVGKQYTATRHHADFHDFACAACHLRTRVFVLGVGEGKGNSAYFLDNGGASERADAAATAAAEANTRLTLSLARCPRCGTRDPAAVRWFWLKMVATLVGSALALWGIGGLIALIQGGADDALMWIFGVLGLAMPPIVWWMESWKWATVDQRVVFEEEPVRRV
jgi:hypothetical protein